VSNGGGEAAILPSGDTAPTIRGEIFLPLDDPSPVSIGVGVLARTEVDWFPPNRGAGLENGVYLEYQNGAGVAIPGVPDHPGEVILFAYDESLTINAEQLLGTATILGRLTVPQGIKGRYVPFSLGADTVAGAVFASLNGTLVYDGPLFGNGVDSGGCVIGFRESHSGLPVSGEGTFVDAINFGSAFPPKAFAGVTLR
jgi:hypothetical protein